MPFSTCLPQANFPVADATVLSSGGRARTAAAANVGTLAGAPVLLFMRESADGL